AMLSHLVRRPPRPALPPYTTLFRSRSTIGMPDSRLLPNKPSKARLISTGYQRSSAPLLARPSSRQNARAKTPIVRSRGEGRPPRSEEHTSELQSRENLVCRLLLETK